MLTVAGKIGDGVPALAQVPTWDGLHVRVTACVAWVGEPCRVHEVAFCFPRMGAEGDEAKAEESKGPCGSGNTPAPLCRVGLQWPWP